MTEWLMRLIKGICSKATSDRHVRLMPAVIGAAQALLQQLLALRPDSAALVRAGGFLQLASMATSDLQVPASSESQVNALGLRPASAALPENQDVLPAFVRGAKRAKRAKRSAPGNNSDERNAQGQTHTAPRKLPAHWKVSE